MKEYNPTYSLVKRIKPESDEASGFNCQFVEITEKLMEKQDVQGIQLDKRAETVSDQSYESQPLSVFKQNFRKGPGVIKGGKI